MMITLEGKSVFGGVAIGKIQFYKRNEITIKRTRVEDVEAEVERFQNAGHPGAKVRFIPQMPALLPGLERRFLQRVLAIGVVPQDRPGYPVHHARAGFDLRNEGIPIHSFHLPCNVTPVRRASKGHRHAREKYFRFSGWGKKCAAVRRMTY